MSKYKYEGYGVIRDTEMDFPYHTDDIAELLEEKDQQITDLQSQLAEKDEQIKRRVAVYEKQFIEQTDEIYKLTQQLAESEKEIEYQENMKILAVDNQNKKAIEQLEKVKDIINASVRDDHIIWDFDIKEHIDNQINELKEMK